MKKIIYLFLIVHCTLIIDNCLCQWQPDARLTNDPAHSSTSYNNAWCIASSGNVVHAVWIDGRDGPSGNTEIYYKRSTDGGTSWGTDTRLTNNSASSSYPSITVSGTAIHVVWQDNREGNNEIYYKRSSDGGPTWGADTRLTNDPGISNFPSVAVSGSVVHAVWYDNRDGNIEVYYKRSSDGGTSWEADTRLTNYPTTSGWPSVSASGSAVHVAWHDFRDGNAEIYYKRSTDGGTNWGADTRLTNNSAESVWLSLSVSGSLVHVVWRDDRDGNYEIYYKRSTDGGVSWGTDTRLTNNPVVSERPNIAVSGLVVHVVWDDNRDGNYEIYYKRSTDGGSIWGADTRLTSNSSFSQYPSVAVSGQVVHVAWADNRDGNSEIYYKRDPTGNVTGIIKINSEIPTGFSLSQNYPNPFNPKTVISFQLPDKSFIILKVFDILGHEVAALVNEQLQPGTYEVEFEGGNYSSGVYYYQLAVGNYSETKKMVLIK